MIHEINDDPTVLPGYGVGDGMIARVVVFFTLVLAMAGATAGLGLVVTEEATACQAYKTC